ncbi:class I SAM-dependent RNA methyltransferase [Mesorhizobium sp. BR1-1-16]|uniref:class I SAM-dependent RNA methyltransferase n=1 Tax=Mesorhizobium sp. BR1-1-16 TaxID=2876653 RepID=UPI001CD00569|nr:class I SAM-dependent RNA methyltransferase [Mesorhizobium sp. BR1-1-16]MBZ9934767.1 class I SAM-dependent RNA methyltransferase [Mesorhizobium sp. BR1-1-16]
MAERLSITSLGHEGDGVAERNDAKIFVPFTLPGETVEAEVMGERGRLVSLIEAGPDRVTPPCRHFGTCGGCSVQHLAPAAYGDWKRGLVETAFAQRGITADVEPLVPLAPHTRRRAVFTIERDGDRAMLGFNRRDSHDLLDIEECPLTVPVIESRLARLRTLAVTVLARSKRGKMIVTATDTGLDVAIEGGITPRRTDYESLGRNVAEGWLARLTIDGVEIATSRQPELRHGDTVLYPAAGGFLQAAAPSEQALADLVDASVGKAGPAVDLFSGIGTFTLRLARRFPVLAVENDASLLKALDRSMRFSKGIRTVTTRRRDLFLNPMAPPELKPFKAVVFDPPRAGAKAQCEMLAKSAVPRIVAVSCNPATLARDARILIDGGYRLTRVTPVDQFLWSSHVEVVAAFEKG